MKQRVLLGICWWVEYNKFMDELWVFETKIYNIIKKPTQQFFWFSQIAFIITSFGLVITALVYRNYILVNIAISF